MVDVVATEEVATVADAMVDVVATEEAAQAADATETVEAIDKVAQAVDATEGVEMTVQMNSIERLVENDQVMLIIDHLKKSSLVDTNDAITMTIKVKI